MGELWMSSAEVDVSRENFTFNTDKRATRWE